MNRVTVLSALILVIFAAGICQADTLVITYKSGKTQTVVLDEPSQGINSWQFVGGAVQQQQSKRSDETPAAVKQEQAQKEAVSPQPSESKTTEKTPEKKSGIRVNWNAKPIAD